MNNGDFENLFYNKDLPQVFREKVDLYQKLKPKEVVELFATCR